MTGLKHLHSCCRSNIYVSQFLGRSDRRLENTAQGGAS